jgi:hypothetical protein
LAGGTVTPTFTATPDRRILVKMSLKIPPPEPEKHWIGKDKPAVSRSSEPLDWPGKLYPLWMLKDEADNLPESPEQAGWEPIREGEH